VGVKEFILNFISRERPFHASGDITVLIPPPLDEIFQSFPSGHTIFFFALATVIYLKDKKWGLVFFLLAGFIGVSRIAVGVHYPTDIMAGVLLGALTGVGVYALYKKFY
jgi:undecaprenyl-diphosphatase